MLKGYKTYIVSALLVAVSLVHLLSGDMSLITFLNSPDLIVLLQGLGLGALRAAM